jgi:hypothetical protein
LQIAQRSAALLIDTTVRYDRARGCAVAVPLPVPEQMLSTSDPPLHATLSISEGRERKRKRPYLFLLLWMLSVGDFLGRADAEPAMLPDRRAVAAATSLPDSVIGSADLKDLVIFTGQCRFQIQKGSSPCDDKVAWINLRSGRSLLAFSKGEILFRLSGERDRQPNLENYYLSIDSLGIHSPDVDAVDRGLEGECHFRLNRDATKFFFVKCDVYNRAQGEMYNFTLDKITKTHHRAF